MRFRLGMVTGFAAGYYLGARAGRQRYDQINRSVARLKRSEAFEEATDRARTVVEEGVEKARSLVDTRAGNGQGPDSADTSGIILPGRTVAADRTVPIGLVTDPEDTTGLIVPGETGQTGPGDYSSSR